MSAPGSEPSSEQHLTEAQVLRLIEIIEEFDPIVIGGQALNLWVQYYRSRSAGFLGDEGAFTSRDLDFYDNMAAAEALADALAGEIKIPLAGDHTPNAALVIGNLDNREITVDFMASVLGVGGDRIANNQVLIEARIPTRQHPIRLLLLHPFDCLLSRLVNINTLHRDDEHSVRQARAAVGILQAFLNELLDDPKRRKHVQTILLDLSYAIRDQHSGKPSHRRHGLTPEDVLKAFCDDKRLDERWRISTLLPCLERVSRWLAPRGSGGL